MAATIRYSSEGLDHELALFDKATCWKAYWSSAVRPHVRGRVLEVGSGNGACVEYLIDRATTWTCLEPDPILAQGLAARIAKGELPQGCVAREGTTSSLPVEPVFETILYLDVLEHIEDDAQELREATLRLAGGGRLIVLSPAHQGLYTAFDEAVGHFRRYSRSSLQSVGPPSLDLVSIQYLDSIGLLASAVNRFLLRIAHHHARHVWFWDRLMVPISRLADPLLRHRVGKSILAVWRRPEKLDP